MNKWFVFVELLFGCWIRLMREMTWACGVSTRMLNTVRSLKITIGSGLLPSRKGQ